MFFRRFLSLIVGMRIAFVFKIWFAKYNFFGITASQGAVQLLS